VTVFVFLSPCTRLKNSAVVIVAECDSFCVPTPVYSVKISDVLVAAECDGFRVSILKDKTAVLTWLQEWS